MDGVPIFQALTHEKVPTEFVGYPAEGHVPERPKALMEIHRRILEWFAYWVLGEASQHMLTQFGPPSSAGGLANFKPCH